MRYTHNYANENTQLTAQGLDWTERAAQLTAQFERDAAEHLQGLRAEDVGAVICYMDSNDEEAAWFDYENFVGSVYAISGQRSFEI